MEYVDKVRRPLNNKNNTYFQGKREIFAYFLQKYKESLAGEKKSIIFAPFLRNTGCSAVRLAHLLWEQGVVGSNPATPTNKEKGIYESKYLSFFFIYTP